MEINDLEFDNDIEELSFLLFTKEEVAIILEITEDDLDDTGSAGHRSYMKGQLLAKVVLRKSVSELVKNGSMEAIKIYSSLLDKIELQKNRRRA